MAHFSDLFELIKSLSKSEKRSFQGYSSFQSGKNGKAYLELYKILQGEKEDDELAINKKLKKKAIFNNISKTKNYLYHVILNSIRTHHEKTTIESKLFTQITNGTILRKKGLNDQSMKCLKKAKVIALKHEKHSICLKIIRQQIVIVLGQSGFEKALNSLYDEVEETMNLLQEEIHYEQLMHQLFALLRKERTCKDPNLKEEIREHSKNQILEKKPTTFKSKISYQYSQAIIQILLHDDLKKANEYYFQIVNTWEVHPHIKNEYPKKYKIYLFNYLTSCHAISNYTLFPEIIAKIKHIPCSTIEEEMEQFQNIQFLELLFFMNTSQYQKALSLIPSLEEMFDRLEGKINIARVISFYYNIFILYFALEDYDSALTWLNKIINIKSNDNRKDIQRSAKVLQLIVHYELTSHQLFTSLNRTIVSGLKKEGKLFEFEKIMLSHIKKLYAAISKKERKTIFQNFKNALDELENSKTLPIYEEIYIWITAKIQNKTFIQILEERKGS